MLFLATFALALVSGATRVKFGKYGIIVNEYDPISLLFVNSRLVNVASLKVAYASSQGLLSDDYIRTYNASIEEAFLHVDLNEWSECKIVDRAQNFVEVAHCPPAVEGSDAAKEFLMRIEGRCLEGEKFVEYESILRLNRKRVPWPLETEKGVWPPELPNKIGQTYDQFQVLYMHNGLDIRSDAPSPLMQLQQNGEVANLPVAGVVRSPLSGKCIFSQILIWGLQKTLHGEEDPYRLNYMVFIMDSQGFVWFISHMEPSTVKVKKGDFVKKGDVLGNVAFWAPVTPGQPQMSHIHLSVGRPPKGFSEGNFSLPFTRGWNGIDPLSFLDHGSYLNKLGPYSNGKVYFFETGNKDAFGMSDEGVVSLSGSVNIRVMFASKMSTEHNSDVSGNYSLGVRKMWWNYESLETGYMSKNKLVFDFDKLYSLTCNILLDENCDLTPMNSLLSFFTYKNETIPNMLSDFDIGYYDISNAGFFQVATDFSKPLPGFDTAYLKNGLYRLNIFASDYWGNVGNVTAVVRILN